MLNDIYICIYIELYLLYTYIELYVSYMYIYIYGIM